MKKQSNLSNFTGNKNHPGISQKAQYQKDPLQSCQKTVEIMTHKIIELKGLGKSSYQKDPLQLRHCSSKFNLRGILLILRGPAVWTVHVNW